MDYSKFLSIGEITSVEYKVKEKDNAHSYGNKGVMVLSTPALLKYIENGASSLLFDRLPEGHSPVGTQVNLNHIGACPVEGTITVESKVIKMERNKVSYNFKVFYKDRLIADGSYKQAIIELKRFLDKNTI